ncbi:MAG: flagellar biosynthetic protein FliR [Candidatus Margulisbacteria bacterium]|nr:flagellar biosynthetic protein FliR [Candidatus Margulisiibacteriota bacterium]
MIISLAQLSVFLLIVTRIGGIMVQTPVFSSRSFPTPAKVALSVWTAAVMWFVVPVSSALPTTTVSLLLVLASEFTIGLLIGLIANLIFVSVQAAGEIIDLQMGLSVAQSFDPIFGSQISIVGRLFFFTMITMFLIINGHHMVLAGVYKSFNMIPAGQLANFGNGALVLQIITLGSKLFAVGFMLSAPTLLILFIMASFVFGIVSRVAPQVNVFMLSFQVRPTLGLIGILLTVPLLVKHIANMLGILGEELLKLLVAIQ